ncbi:HpcH/HpaI aldolase/citrate lyase family protein [Bradyrhizobium sp. Pha-3]|uniref:HpcH/HpaI aldolase/citrate lyase family protein n=1 Tax=Bradyrhizobium sp. Pha-3 TaxID=208375 RepID=UPI0035D44A12
MTDILDFVAPLFAPAHRSERFEKAAASGADAIILDLEDGVPQDVKQRARSVIDANFTSLPVFVRINGSQTEWHEADLAAALSGQFSGIVLPKSEAGPDLDRVCARALEEGIRVIALVETAKGIRDVHAIARTEGVARLVFGSVDFCADIGAAHSREALLSARSEVVLASRTAGIPSPVDGVTTAINDLTLVKSDARHACDLGFRGKLCIHPKQVEPVRAAFRPTVEEIAWATAVLSSGEGAVMLGGDMVDEPVRIRARAIITRSK